MSWAIWITGLPGSGKSTVTSAVKEKIPDAVILRLDELRKIVTPEPTYSDAEREYVYRALIFTAKTLHELGHKIIIDATGNKRAWRELARDLIPDFHEVYLKCPIGLCMEREKTRVDTHAAPRQIYEKGGKGWPVPGVNVPYEEPDNPDVVIDSEKESPHIAADKILDMLKKEIK
ncbi:MAG: adenylyl-sulfate kinase [Nitrospirae bacterium]|nr:adenylyl-sulfate kinase [Nitrospirota bacterium]